MKGTCTVAYKQYLLAGYLQIWAQIRGNLEFPLRIEHP